MDPEKEKLNEPTPKELEMQKSLERIEKTVSARNDHTNALMELLQDENVQKIIEAKKAGKAVTVAEAAQEDPLKALFEDVAEDEDDGGREGNGMDDKLKGLVQLLPGMIGKIMDEKLGVVIGRLDNIEIGGQQEKAQAEIERLAKSEGDNFFAAQETMVKTTNRVPGLSVTELFKLADYDRLKKDSEQMFRLLQSASDSERPFNLQGQEMKRPEVVRHGRKGIAEMIAEARQKAT